MTLAELIVKLGLDSSGLASGLDKAKTQLDGFQQKFDSWAGALAKALPFAVLGAEAFNVGTRFDEAFDRIRAATGDVGPALDSLTTSLKNVYRQSEESLMGLTEAMTLLHQRTGLSGAALEEMTLKISYLATLTGSQLQPMIQGITQAFAAWGIESSKQAGTMDFLLKVYQQSGVSMETLLASITQNAPALKDLSISFETGAVMIAKWKKEGVDAELVFNGLKLSLKAFAKANEEPIAALQRLTEEIMNAGSVTEAHRIGLEHFGKAGIYMADQIRAGKLEVADFAKTVAASTETVAAAREATLSFAERWKILGHEMEVALLPLGESLLKMASIGLEGLKPLLDLMGDLVKQFTELPMPVQAAVIAMTGIQAILPLLAKLTGGLVSAQSGIASLAKAAGLLGAAWAGQKLGEWLQQFTSDYKKAEVEVEKLADMLRAQGEVVERGGLSLEDYAKKVFAIAEALDEWWKAENKAYDAERKAIDQLKVHTGAVDTLAKAYKTLGVTSFHDLVKSADAATAAYERVRAAFRRGEADISDVERSYNSMLAAQQKVIDAYGDLSKRIGDFLSGFSTAGQKATSTLAQLVFSADVTRASWGMLIGDLLKFSAAAQSTTGDGKLLTDALVAMTKPLRDLDEAYKSLGQQSTQALQERLKQTTEYYRVIVEKEGELSRNALLAEKNMLEARIAAYKAAGQALGEGEEERYRYLEGLLGKHVEKQVKFLDTLAQMARDSTRLFGDTFAELIVEGGKWGEAMISILKQVAEAIISTLITGALNDLLHAIGLLSDKAWAAGDSLIRIFTGIGDSASKAGKAATDAAAAATAAAKSVSDIGTVLETGQTVGGTAGGAGGAAGGAGGLVGIITMVASVVSAVTDVINVFQQMHQETSLNAIEWNTRKSSLHLEALLNNANQYWPAMSNINEVLWKIYGYISTGLDATINDLIQTLRGIGTIPVPGEPAPAPPPGEPAELAPRDTRIPRPITPTVPGSGDKQLLAFTGALTDAIAGVDSITDGANDLTDALGDAAQKLSSTGADFGGAIDRSLKGVAAGLGNAFTDIMGTVTNVARTAIGDIESSVQWMVDNMTRPTPVVTEPGGSTPASPGNNTYNINVTVNNADAQMIAELITRELQFSGARA